MCKKLICQTRDKHGKHLLQTFKCRKQITSHILESQIQHHFKFNPQILLQIMIWGEELKSHYELHHTQGMTLRSGFVF
jgi:hypothetical protein